MGAPDQHNTGERHAQEDGNEHHRHAVDAKTQLQGAQHWPRFLFLAVEESRGHFQEQEQDEQYPGDDEASVQGVALAEGAAVVALVIMELITVVENDAKETKLDHTSGG